VHEIRSKHEDVCGVLRNSKRIVYIAGCGRSGTTILGFALGNMGRAIDLGEVLDFVKFKGSPNGFGPDTANYKFWDNVRSDVASKLCGIDFDSLKSLERKLDSHQALLRSVLLAGRAQPGGLEQYRGFLKALYERLLKDDRYDVFIDSSKYPSRLHHLLRVFEDETVCVVHLMRNPIELARTFRKDKQSGRKSFLETMLYFFVVNTLIVRVTRGLDESRYQRLYFEDLIAEPVQQVDRIAKAFGLDATMVLQRIRDNLPLPRGFIFNGNRMRVRESVRLERRLEVAPALTVTERAFERAFDAWFGSRTTPK
jgi:hypothetical protein